MMRHLPSSLKGTYHSFTNPLKDVRFLIVAENLQQDHVPGTISMP